MLFGILVVLMVGFIAYYHYLQGFFSAVLSAVLAVFSALLTLSLHETVLYMTAPGKFPDTISAVLLCVMFAVIYIALRFLFDGLVPGNIRLPLMVDRIGAPIFGVIAGMFALGIVAIAAQTLPVSAGLSFMGYARYALADTAKVTVPPVNGQAVDALLVDDLRPDPSEPHRGQFAKRSQSLLLPVDDVVINLLTYASGRGSLSGDVRFGHVHPDYLQELFGQRLGLDAGAKHTAYNFAGDRQVNVKKIFLVDSLPQIDAELQVIRQAQTDNSDVPKVLTAAETQGILVIRTMIRHAASDADDLFRFTCGGVRLCAKHVEGSDETWKNYYPIGTVEDAQVLYSNHLDDLLLVDLKKEDRMVDLVFLVDDKHDVIQNVDNHEIATWRITPGTFLEVKRLARIDLSDPSDGNDAGGIGRGITADPKVGALRKKAVLAAGQAATRPAAGQPAVVPPPTPPTPPSPPSGIFTPPTPAPTVPVAPPPAPPANEMAAIPELHASVPADFVEHKIAGSGITLKAPKTWQELATNPAAGGPKLLVTLKDTVTGSVFTLGLNPPDPKDTVASVVAQAPKELPAQFPGFVPIKFDAVKLNGEPVAKLVFDADPGQKLRLCMVMILRKDGQYGAMFMTAPDKFDAALPVLEQVLVSMQIPQAK